jgi:hypothetical protein
MEFELGPNNTFAQAQNVDAFFTRDFNANIGDKSMNTSESIPNVTIMGTGDGSFDYYSFTIADMNDMAIFDIDYGHNVDTLITLFDTAGDVLSDNDDAEFFSWGAGGSTTVADSYLERAGWPSVGNFVIRVGALDAFDPSGVLLPSGASYTLQISIQNHAVGTAVPEPSLAAIFGIGTIASMIFCWKRRRLELLGTDRG